MGFDSNATEKSETVDQSAVEFQEIEMRHEFNDM
jgi:hypothetical protein